MIESEEGYSKIRIKQRGAWKMLLSGWVGEKDIPVSQITSIVFREASSTVFLTSYDGVIQLSFLGSDDSEPVAQVRFDYTQNKAFEEIKKAIEQKMAGCSSNLTVDTRLCPYCAEAIKKAAIVCKHCGRDVPPGHAAADSSS